MSIKNDSLYKIDWYVFDSYSCEDGYIFPSGDKKLQYNPVEYPSLPTDFSKINHISTESLEDDVTQICIDELKSFISKFGLLGYSIEKKEPMKIKGSVREYDSLIWALDHAYYVDSYLTIQKYIQEIDESNLKKILLKLKIKQEKNTYLGLPTLQGYSETQFDFSTLDKNPIKLGKNICKIIVNNNIGHVGLRMEDEGIVTTLNSLIQYIYLIMAFSTFKYELRQCKECGAIFFTTDKRQKFCPPINTIESPCAKRYRMRRLRKK